MSRTHPLWSRHPLAVPTHASASENIVALHWPCRGVGGPRKDLHIARASLANRVRCARLLRKKFEAQAAAPIGNTPQEIAMFPESERAVWGDVIDKTERKAE